MQVSYIPYSVILDYKIGILTCFYVIAGHLLWYVEVQIEI